MRVRRRTAVALAAVAVLGGGAIYLYWRRRRVPTVVEVTDVTDAEFTPFRSYSGVFGPPVTAPFYPVAPSVFTPGTVPPVTDTTPPVTSPPPPPVVVSPPPPVYPPPPPVLSPPTQVGPRPVLPPAPYRGGRNNDPLVNLY